MKGYSLVLRTDLEETKKINHHGHIREVTTNDAAKELGQDGYDKDTKLNNDTIKALQIVDYFDFAFQTELVETEGRPTPKIAFGDPDDVYDNSEEKRERKLKIMNACIFFSRNIKPVIIIIFVLIYWGSGLIRANQIE